MCWNQCRLQCMNYKKSAVSSPTLPHAVISPQPPSLQKNGQKSQTEHDEVILKKCKLFSCSYLQVLSAHELDICLHCLCGDRVPPECQMLVLHRRYLVDDNLCEDVLRNVLRVKDAHEAERQLLLDLHVDVRLEGLAEGLVLVLWNITCCSGMLVREYVIVLCWSDNML
jgi:hypothetical protein